MKAYLFVALLALAPTLGACGKKNDVPILQHEASALAKYYQPKLEALDARIAAIMKRGQTIPADFPGVKEIGLQLQEARDTVVKLRAIVGAPGQKSAVETQAEAAAKDNKLPELRKLVHDTEKTLVDGVTLVQTDLDAVETWIQHYDNKTLAMLAPAKAEQPGQPETVSTPATGQPPAAVQQGSAAPAAAQGSAAPAQGSAAPAPPAQPKAEPKKAPAAPRP
jgi:hypothetical protein